MRRPTPSVCQPLHPHRGLEHPPYPQRNGSSDTRRPRVPSNRKRRSICFTKKVRRRFRSYACSYVRTTCILTNCCFWMNINAIRPTLSCMFMPCFWWIAMLSECMNELMGGRFGGVFTWWVSEWVTERLSEWMNEWRSELTGLMMNGWIMLRS